MRLNELYSKVNNSAKIMTLADLKLKKEQKKVENELNDYLQILSFGELIDETTTIINEINNRPLTQDIALKSKQILKELGLRINGQTMRDNASVKQMRSDLEKKIIEIQGLLH